MVDSVCVDSKCARESHPRESAYELRADHDEEQDNVVRVECERDVNSDGDCRVEVAATDRREDVNHRVQAHAAHDDQVVGPRRLNDVALSESENIVCSPKQVEAE